MRCPVSGQRGSILVIFALSLVVLIGFAALGIETGQWYLTQAELSKAVDAGALAGAANVSNPYLQDPAKTVANDFAIENFQTGYLGTPKSGSGAANFSVAQNQQTGQVTVTGQTNASSLLAGVLGFNNVAVKSAGAAVMNHVQIVLVLDRSGSMAGAPIQALQNAVRTFIGFFEDPQIQAQNQIGLVSFATNVTTDVNLEYNYYTAIINATNALRANGATNSEEALYQAGNELPDESQVDTADRIPEYIVFFTDGRPTAFTSTFKNKGKPFQAVLASSGNCDSASDQLYGLADPTTGDFYGANQPSAVPTGDGLNPGQSVCPKQNGNGNRGDTRWGSFAQYPVPGLGYESYPAYCGISSNLLDGQSGYICQTAHQMAIDIVNGGAGFAGLKNRDVQVYCVGLGNEIDKTFLGSLASGSNYLFIAPNPGQLQSIFSTIAQDIKLRLVQ